MSSDKKVVGPGGAVMPGPGAPGSPGAPAMPGLGYGYNDDVNSWDGSGAQPNVGTKNSPSKTPTNGYNNSPPTSTALNVASTDDYTGWNWEQILNGVLGLTLPSRNEITDLRWTATDSNMSEDHSLFKIFGAAWGNNKDFLVYLNPALQDSGGPWDEFYNTPSNQLAAAISGSTFFPGVLDPRDFASYATALQDVEYFYTQAAVAFSQVDQGGNTAAQFQGAAGQAFYQLTSNLNTNAQSILAQMVPSTNSSYSDMIANSGQQAANFIVGLWNALVGWINQRLDWSPMGAIFQALLDGGVVTNNGGSYSVVNVMQNDTFGNLLTDEGWLQVETAAKSLWNAAVAASLDEVARPLILNLAATFGNTAAAAQPLQPPGMTSITPASSLNTPAAGLNTPAAGLNTPDASLGAPGGALGNLPGGAGAGLNTPVSALGDPGAGLGPGAGLNTPVTALGNPGAGLGPGAGLNTPVTALANPGAGLGPGAGLNTPVTALANPGAGLGPGAGLNTPATALANPPAPLNALAANPNTVAASLGTTPAAASALQNALGDSQAEQKQLQKALSLAPKSGPLHNALENALAANSQQQNALQNGLAGNTPVGEALGNALADNGKVQSALGNAMNSGQVPANGPLRTALQRASGDNAAAKTAAEHALSAGVPGGGELQKALAGNGRAENALHQALASGQVPRTGPLHDTLTKALTDVGQSRHALDQALQGGATEPHSIQQAVTDNKAAQAQLQRALAQAPKTGPLHNELTSALADTRQTGTALHQALTTAGVPAELGKIDGSPTAGLGDLKSLLGGGKGMVSSVGAPSPLSAGPGGVAHVPGGAGAFGMAGASGAGASGVAGVNGPASGLSGGTAATPGQLTSAQGATGSGTGAVPFFPPMAGGGMGGMGGGAQGQPQERERTTWLAEDEDVWGTDPELTPNVLGRDFADDEDDLDAYEEYAEPESESQQAPSRARGR